MAKKTELYLLVVVCFLGLVQRSTALLSTYTEALVDISFYDNLINQTVNRSCGSARYGGDSPLEAATGIVTLPSSDPMGCAQDSFNDRNASSPPWIALIKRGSCTYSEKINIAKRQGAAAVVVYYKDGSGNSKTNMAHSDTTGIVAVTIAIIPGMEVVNLVKRGIEVRMIIEYHSVERPWITPLLLVVPGAVYFIVYFGVIGTRRLHNWRRWLSEVNEEIVKLSEERTMKSRDEETASDSHICTICKKDLVGVRVVTVTVLPCKPEHIFHRACIEQKVLKNKTFTCPMCMCDILALGVEAREEPLRGATDLPTNPRPRETSASL